MFLNSFRHENTSTLQTSSLWPDDAEAFLQARRFTEIFIKQAGLLNTHRSFLLTVTVQYTAINQKAQLLFVTFEV